MLTNGISNWRGKPRRMELAGFRRLDPIARRLSARPRSLATAPRLWSLLARFTPPP